MYQNILRQTSHRETPLPGRPWLLTQKWDHLLFMHVPVLKQAIKPLLPPQLELDTYDGEAWISIVPFEVTGMHARWAPEIPFLSSYLELNVRTYVKYQGHPGVYFFSLDANLLTIVLGAKTFSLPYYYADMEMKETNGHYTYRSIRKKAASGDFEVSYHPVSKTYSPEHGSLSHWLMERYVFWQKKGNGLIQGDVHHLPWEVQDASADIDTETLTSFLPPPSFSGETFYHYADSRRVLLWPLKKVT
ncbi:YqjF family protein [Thalassobacillus sp. B23F22_16]|uniref:YqjF family protein n=1 Tax=Thalassobacillus sp. B23F22_16 TaxID=3459513 RepID=UPI00373E9F96